MDQETGIKYMTEQEIYEAQKAEWVDILKRMWTVLNKPPDLKQLEIYTDELGEIPLGLLEQAVGRCIRENQYNNVPSGGAVWQALRRELGNPYDICQAIGEWVQAKADKSTVKFSSENGTLPARLRAQSQEMAGKG